MSTYYASKAYVNSFSAALSEETAGTGVTVTCLEPGVVRTAFFERCAVGQSRLMKLMPRSSAADTAEAGWRGFKAGKSLVYPARDQSVRRGGLPTVAEKPHHAICRCIAAPALKTLPVVPPR